MLPLAILAGIAQALGSVLGKFAFGSVSLLPALAINGCLRVFSDGSSLSASCWMVGCMYHARVGPFHSDHILHVLPQAAYPVRGILMLLMMTSNSYGMMMMVNGMKESGSYLGTVLVTASNFICSVSSVGSNPKLADLRAVPVIS